MTTNSISNLRFRPGQLIRIVYYNQSVDEGYYIRHTPAQIQIFKKDGTTYNIQFNAIEDVLGI